MFLQVANPNDSFRLNARRLEEKVTEISTDAVTH